ncbi:MAG: tRNA pseudouridine(13) synthase TruD [Candidatus Helarchaeota archaeon]|nr:tRNA pseudouridine(13) synthase TruD [Candidatus Helarchaeota archaeon]
MEAHRIEKEIGIKTFLTHIPGIGGKLRTKIEDFIVEEIAPDGNVLKKLDKTDLNLANLPRNHYTYTLILEKHNLETMALIHQLAAYLQIPFKNIGFAGLKDKRAITVQQISISGGDIQNLINFHKKGMYLNRIQPGKHIKLGGLNGNHFEIILRQISGSIDEIQKNIKNVAHQILTSQLPNYYGPQRFGALRPISHRMGRALLSDDFETALKIYLTEVFPQEDKEIQEIRTTLKDSWPHCNLIFPKSHFYENKIIHYLKNKDFKFEKIFKKIFPFRFFLLFIHAYQSYLFNNLLNARIAANLSLDQPLEGDFVAILDQYSLPTRVIYEVKSNNISSLKEAISKGKALIMAPLFGYDLNFSRHPLADYITRLFNEEKIDLSLFNTSSNKKLHLKVTYRPILFKPKDFSVSLEKPSKDSQDYYVEFNFSLNKGCYATILLREFMKTSPLNY